MNMVSVGPKVCIVVAMSRGKQAIGMEGKLLWHIPEDMKRFKELTMGHPVIMGRKTFESIVSYIGKPLPGRTNIVVTRNADYTYPGIIVAPTLTDAIENAKILDAKEVHIGGGSEIYAQALPLVDRLYLTLIDDEKDADTFFPEYKLEFTKVISSEKRHTEAGVAYEWLTLDRTDTKWLWCL
jgi:dihydrofolate reductase